MNGVSDGPRRYEIQYQIVAPTAITQTATISAERAEREARPRQPPLEQLLARGGIGGGRHTGNLDNTRSR